MGIKFGLDMKLYYAASTPSIVDGKFDMSLVGEWTRVNHLGLQMNHDAVEDDVTVDGSTFELSAFVLHKMDLKFTVMNDPDVAFTGALFAAYWNKSTLPLVLLTDQIDVTGARGVAGYFGVKFNPSGDLKTAQKLEVTPVLTYDSVVLPHQVTIA